MVDNKRENASGREQRGHQAKGAKLAPNKGDSGCRIPAQSRVPAPLTPERSATGRQSDDGKRQENDGSIQVREVRGDPFKNGPAGTGRLKLAGLEGTKGRSRQEESCRQHQ
jgi:hypothetical protein